MSNRFLAFLFALIGVSAQAQTSPQTSHWPASTPGAVGMDQGAIRSFDADISAGKYGYIDSMLIIRHGKVAFDRSYPHDYDRVYSAEAAAPGPLNAHDRTGPYNYFNPWWHPFYRRGELHSLQSATKTVTSVVIGIATARKEFPSLDTPVLKYFDFFAPLGIVQHFWKRSPTGLIDTEGGLYLRSHDLAKIGHLYLKNGVWEGKALVEPEWVKASVTPSSAVSADGVKYGYKWWLIPYGNEDPRLAWAAQGFGGQRVIVFRDYDLVVVFTGWNILPDRPALSGRVAVDRMLAAVTDRRP